MDTTTFAATAAFPHTALVGVTGPEDTFAVQGDPHAVLPLASVTKPLTAWGALVAIDHALADLDEPAGPVGRDRARPARSHQRAADGGIRAP